MKVALTGATGFIGSHVLTNLLDHGHEVTALLRDDRGMDALAVRGVKSVVVDLVDQAGVTEVFASTDGAVHTASPGDASSAQVDSSVADAAIAAYGGSGRPYVHTGGVWTYGNSVAITEESPFDSSSVIAWRAAIEDRLLAADGVRTTIAMACNAYGDGGSGSIPGIVLGSPRDAADRLIVLGSGEQRWALVHAADLADFYRRALENDAAHGRYIVGNGAAATLRELTEAAAASIGAAGVVPGSVEEAHNRLGEGFADALLQDQVVTTTKAADELGWRPVRPTLLEVFQGVVRS
ncbi:NAD-dependent epimerase/dehydratase family protein [Kribbella sandramycini]|uniref:NAD-dependent epimerase/dehydratase family protein n=1 Tax=Kribbella sandramycini TaxID=60450 RepID=A0A7Y4L7I6_9ACTN|nr:NAD-dependent epimerase/dehydratase family protein [Kribbella sandramycini]MBB6567226.1 nucleoside-diphosphate-sugar epimerase [Kribbella sandramycini]NOL45763.1 NAD-dependent epimerase/dehydratase family protein [Kribbella sandramycini]